MTPSHVAAAHGEVGVLAFLLGHHANANKVDEDNWTPLAFVLTVLSKETRVFWHGTTTSISRCAACFLKPKLKLVCITTHIHFQRHFAGCFS